MRASAGSARSSSPLELGAVAAHLCSIMPPTTRETDVLLRPASSRTRDEQQPPALADLSSKPRGALESVGVRQNRRMVGLFTVRRPEPYGSALGYVM